MAPTRTAEPVLGFNAAVLAGGKSTRMGTDKAGLSWRGRPLLQHMQELLQLAGARRVLTCGVCPGMGGLPDPVPGLGPLGGLLTLARTQPDGIYLLLPVDMPLLNVCMLRQIASALTDGAEAPCVAFAGHVLPLGLRLDAATRAAIERTAAQPQHLRSLRSLHARLAGMELALATGDRGRLVNCNTPDEWREVQA